MGQDTLYYLDAETKSEEFRVTTFSYYLEDLVKDLSSWMQDRDLKFTDMAYATICRCDDREPVADIVADENGFAVLQPREPDNRLIHRIVLWFRRRSNR